MSDNLYYVCLNNSEIKSKERMKCKDECNMKMSDGYCGRLIKLQEE